MSLKQLNWKRHFIVGQPPETFGKRVVYKCANGHICVPNWADELNWKSASFGAIKEYAVL